MEPVDIVPPEKVAFIAYNIGVYESVQKFGGLITSGKITSNTDVAKVAELLSESNAFYDAEMISQLVNAMQQQHRKNSNKKSYCSRGKLHNQSIKGCRCFYSMIRPNLYIFWQYFRLH